MNLISKKSESRRLARKIMEKHLKRKLTFHEIVHHKDKNPFNNHLNNLLLMTSEEHTSLHHAGTRGRIGHPAINKLSKSQVKKILKLYSKFHNYSKVARKTGISDECIRRYVLKEVKVIYIAKQTPTHQNASYGEQNVYK